MVAWTSTQCAWAVQTLQFDAELDQAAAEAAKDETGRALYLGWVRDWRRLKEMAQVTCRLEHGAELVAPPAFYTAPQGRWAQRPLTVAGCRYAAERLEAARAIHQMYADVNEDRPWHSAWARAYAGLIAYFGQVC